jgi:hypothetical protein
VIGIGQQVQWEQFLHRFQKQLDASDAAEVVEPVQISPTDHHHMSLDTRQKFQLRQWLKGDESDPALRVSPQSTQQCLF